MPWPVSETVRQTALPLPVARTVTCPPGSVNFTAFESRFQITCSSRSRSPRTVGRSAAKSVRSFTFFAAAAGWTASIAEPTIVATSRSTTSSRILPVAILAMSSMSEMSVS